MKIGSKEFDEEEIFSALQLAYSVTREKIRFMDIDKRKVSYWQLYLSGREGLHDPLDIRPAAASMGFLTLLELAEDIMGTEISDLLGSTCETILWMRNDDGSWSSILFSTKEAPRMEGLINDTVYALDGLLKLGFLEDRCKITLGQDPKTGKDLNNLNERIDLVMKSIEWLLNNKVRDGWYYRGIGIGYLEQKDTMPPAVLPTSNVIIILHRVIESLNHLRKDHALKKGMTDAYKSTINWLRSIQSPKGGFGRKRGDKPTIVHTAIAIKALLTNESEDSQKTVMKAIRWILKNRESLFFQKLEDVLDEYDQIVFPDEESIRRRVVHHENFLEGIVLDSLMEADEKGHIDKLKFIEKYQFREFARTLVSELLKRQKRRGELQGAFRCRRSDPWKKYPIYAIYFAVLGLKSLKDNLESVLKKPSLPTLVGWGTVLCVVFLTITYLISWTSNLSLIKAIGVFLIQILIVVFGLLIQRFLPGKQ